MYKTVLTVSLRIILTSITVLTIVWAGIIEPTPALSQAPSDSCETLIQDAITLVGTSCAALGRNEACYGHTLVAATFQEDTSAARFEASGDVAQLADLEALVTKPADPDAGTWGVALMKVQADLPDEGNAALTFVLLGDTEVTSAVDPALSTCTLTNSGTQNLNVRGGPGTNRTIIDVLRSGESVGATGRNEAGDWLRIAHNAVTGWVYAPLVSADCELTTLPVVEESAPAYTRLMQAFTLSSGSISGCEQAPDGLLIRSPSGQRAHVMVNGVELEFASAAFLTAQPDGVLAVEGLEGSVMVTAANVSVTVTPGQQTSVPLVGLEAAGPPSTPVPVETRSPAANVLTALDAIDQPPSVVDTGGTETVESPVVEPPPTDGPFVPGTYIETLTVTDLYLPEGCEMPAYFPSSLRADVADKIGDQDILEVYLAPVPDGLERTVYTERGLWSSEDTPIGIYGNAIFEGAGGTYLFTNNLPCRTDAYEIQFTSATTYDFELESWDFGTTNPECDGAHRLIEGTSVWQPEDDADASAHTAAVYPINDCRFTGKPARAGQNMKFTFEVFSCNYETAEEMEQYTLSIDVGGEPLEVTPVTAMIEYEYNYVWTILGYANWTATSGTHTVTAVSDYPCDGSPGADLMTCTFTIP